MRIVRQVRCFLRNEAAISEEFTTLPALSVVMIGFSLFLLLLAQTYIAYEERMEQLQEYQTADTLVRKLTNPDCPFMRPGGLIDVNVLQQDATVQVLHDQYLRSGIPFVVRLHWDDITVDFPEVCNMTVPHRVAVTRQIGVFLNEAQTVQGTLTVILWRCTE
jgi:hypothetical protein